jgi:hypothetical protein
VSFEHALEWTGLMAVLLALLHVASPWIRRRVQGWWDLLAPVGAGALAAYIFLHLLPSLEETETEFGVGIAIVVLAGFVVYFGVEGFLDDRPGHLFWVKIAVGWLYSFLIVYSLPSSFEAKPASAVVSFAALGLHVLQSDNRLAAEDPEPFDTAGRYVLATSPLAAIGLDVVVGPPSVEVAAFLSAFVAGILLLGLFRDELGNRDGQRHFGLFLVGILVYGSLIGLEELLSR